MRHRNSRFAIAGIFILASTNSSKAEIIVVGSDVPGIEIGTRYPDDWTPEGIPSNRSVRVMLVRPGQEPTFRTIRAEHHDGEVDFRMLGTLRGKQTER
jgi:hypothetical protein